MEGFFIITLEIKYSSVQNYMIDMTYSGDTKLSPNKISLVSLNISLNCVK